MLAGRGRQNIPVSLGRGALAWPSEVSDGHQPLLTGGERALLCSGVLSEKLKFSLEYRKSCFFQLLRSGCRKENSGMFFVSQIINIVLGSCVVRDVHDAPHLATALEFWLFQGCTGIGAFPGLAVGRWDLLMSISEMK